MCVEQNVWDKPYFQWSKGIFYVFICVDVLREVVFDVLSDTLRTPLS